MSPPPEDEQVRPAPSNRPEPRPFYNPILGTAAEAPPSGGMSGLARLMIAGIILLIVILIVIGSVYFVEWQTPRRSLSSELAEPTSTPIPPPIPPPVPLATSAPVTPDMLHATSIALGNVHLAMVNGKRLAEGDWLVLTTPDGVATLRVQSIEDGVVHFEYGKKTIDASLQVLAPLKTPPPH